jgi:hypothetical protein
MASLFERLGGLDAIMAVVDSFVARCAGDDQEAEQQELLGVLGPMREEIVEVQSSDTGTALPETYRTAPALG